MKSKIEKVPADGEEIKSQVYEVGFLLVPTITEGEVSKKTETIRKKIIDMGGKIVAEGSPVLRDLAYEMSIIVSNKREIYGSGYFGWIKFEGDSAQTQKIDDELKKDVEIIRFILIKTVLEDIFAEIEKILNTEAEEKKREVIKEEEKVLELKNKQAKKEREEKEKAKIVEPISKEEIDETIDKLIAE